MEKAEVRGRQSDKNMYFTKSHIRVRFELKNSLPKYLNKFKLSMNSRNLHGGDYYNNLIMRPENIIPYSDATTTSN
jgi:hypothetical protein